MKIFLLLFGFIVYQNFCIAQIGLQLGASASSIFNSNRISNVFNFQPIANIEAALIYKKELANKINFKLELGLVSKGGQQKIVNNFNATVYRLPYLYSALGMQYLLPKNYGLNLNIAPAYLVGYYRTENNSTINYISTINRRYKADAFIQVGVSKYVGKLNEFSFRYAQSTAPFASTKNSPPLGNDAFYNIGFSVLYSLYFDKN